MSTTKDSVILEIRVTGGKTSKGTIAELTKTITAQEIQARKLTASLKGTGGAYKVTGAAATTTAKKLAEVKVALAGNRAEFNKYKKSIIGGSASIKSSFASLATTMLSVTAAFYAMKRAVTAVVKNFATFESTLTHVHTLLDAVHAEFKEGALNIMRKYGFSIRDVNKALFDTISAMIAADKALDFLHDAAELAIGGVTTLKVAVDGLTSILNAYQLQTEEASRVSAAFFRAQKFGKTTVADLVENIGRVAPIASIANVSYQEMLGTLAELTLGGLNTRESVTILRQAIAGLIKPAEGARKVLEKFSVPTGIAEVRAAGLTYSLERLTMAAMENPDVIAEMIPNIRAFTGVAALTGARLEHLKMIIEDVNTNFGVGSSLSIAFAKELNTLTIQSRKWNASIVAWTVNLGEKLKPTLIWLMNNTPYIARTVASLAAAFVLVKSSVWAATGGIKAFSAALRANPIGLAIAGVTVLIALIWNLSARTREMSKAQEEFNKELGETKFEMNLLFEELKSDNLERKRKLELIAQLNTEYEKYLKSLIDEADSLEDIAEKQKVANEMLAQQLSIKYMAEDKREALGGIGVAASGVDIALSESAGLLGLSPEERAILSELSYEVADLINKGGNAEQQMKKLRDEIDRLMTKLPRGATLFEDLALEIIGVSEVARRQEEEIRGLAEALDILVEAMDAYDIKSADLKAYYSQYASSGSVKETKEKDTKALGTGRFRDMSGGGLMSEMSSIQESIAEDSEKHRVTLKEEYVRLLSIILNANLGLLADEEQTMEKRIALDVKAARLKIAITEALTDTRVTQIREYEFYLFKSMQERIDDGKKLSASERKELSEAKKKYRINQIKAENDYNKQLAALQSKQKDAAIAAMPDNLDKELAVQERGLERKLLALDNMLVKEGEKYTDQVKKREITQAQADAKLAGMKVEANQYKEALEIAHYEKVYEINREWLLKIRQEAREDDPRFLTDEVYQAEVEYLNKMEDIWVALEDKKITSAEATAKYKQATLKKMLALDEMRIKSNQQLVDDELVMLKRKLDNQLISQEMYEIAIADLKYKYNVRGAVTQYAEELKLLKDKLYAGIIEEKEYLEKLDKLREEHNIKTEETESEKAQAWKEFAGEKAREMSDMLFQFWAEHDQRATELELERVSDRYDTTHDLLKSRLDRGLMTELEFQRKKEAADKKRREEEEKIRKKEWKRQRRRDLIKIAVSGLIAIARSFADAGPIAGIPLAAIMAAITTGLSMGVTAWADKYGKGGTGGAKAGILGGKPHTAGGTHLYGDDGSHFEMERDELFAVVNKRDTETLMRLSDINSAHGKQFAFASGGIGGGMALPQTSSVDQSVFIADLLGGLKIVVDIDEIVDAAATKAEVEEMARL